MASVDLGPYLQIPSGDTSLKIAVMFEDSAIAGFLLKSGYLVDAPNFCRRTPLHWAAVQDDKAMVDLLLQFRCNPNARDDCLRTPSMLAGMNGHKEALRALSTVVIDFHVVDCCGKNVLHHAAGNVEVLLYLMVTMTSYDLLVEDKIGYSILALAFQSGKDRLSMLLNIAPSLLSHAHGVATVVTAAVENPAMTITDIKMLLKRIPNEDLRELLAYKAHHGGTPLYAACTVAAERLQSAIIDLLLNAGAELETEGGDYGTPLTGACAAGRLLAVKVLIGKDAKLVYTKDGQTFSALRAAKHFQEIIRWSLVERYLEGPKRLTAGKAG